MKKKILIVNDEAPVRLGLKELLAREGYEILEARDGREGIKLSAKEKPSLVILELIMPGLDGYTVLARLQGNARTRKIKVIVVSAREGEIYREIASELGAADFLSYSGGLEAICRKTTELLASS